MKNGFQNKIKLFAGRYENNNINSTMHTKLIEDKIK